MAFTSLNSKESLSPREITLNTWCQYRTSKNTSLVFSAGHRRESSLVESWAELATLQMVSTNHTYSDPSLLFTVSRLAVTTSCRTKTMPTETRRESAIIGSWGDYVTFYDSATKRGLNRSESPSALNVTVPKGTKRASSLIRSRTDITSLGRAPFKRTSPADSSIQHLKRQAFYHHVSHTLDLSLVTPPLDSMKPKKHASHRHIPQTLDLAEALSNNEQRLQGIGTKIALKHQTKPQWDKTPPASPKSLQTEEPEADHTIKKSLTEVLNRKRSSLARYALYKKYSSTSFASSTKIIGHIDNEFLSTNLHPPALLVIQPAGSCQP